MARVLLLEDDAYLAQLLTDALSASLISVDYSADGAEAAERLKNCSYDVLILDWDVPGLEGIELLRRFRDHGGDTPAIFISGKRSIDEKETGFRVGADDYLAKPFNVRELVVRVQALLRRGAVAAKHTQISVGGIVMDTQAYKVSVNGEDIVLSRKEFEVLEYFLRRPNQVLSLEAVLNNVWGSQSDASTETVRTTIGRLRKKIQTNSNSCSLAVMHGVGYILQVSS